MKIERTSPDIGMYDTEGQWGPCQYYLTWEGGAHTRVSGFPGQCGAVVMHDVHLVALSKDTTEQRLKDVLEFAKSLGNTHIYLTDVKHHKSFIDACYSVGFELVDEFTNRRTDNDVVVLRKKL